MKKILCLMIVFLSIFNQNSKAIEKTDGQKYVEKIASGIFDIISNKKLTLEQQKKLLLDKFIDEIDFNWNARAAVGRVFNEMTDVQKKDFVSAYKDFLIKVWMPKFKGYSNETYKVGQEIEVQALKTDSNVPIVITLNDGKTITIELRIRKSQNYYKILNITAEGVDMARTYNSQFSEYIDKHGINGLIDYLKTGKSLDSK